MTEVKVLLDPHEKSFTVNYNNDQWFWLKIPFTGSEKIKIVDILINNESIDYYIYTGEYITSTGQRFMPCTELWEPGEFKIYLHTNIGFFKSRLCHDIDAGDFGTDLNKKYLFTYDNGISISEHHSETLRSFMSSTYEGPRWWKYSDAPYEILNLDFNQTKIIKETERLYKSIENIDYNSKLRKGKTLRGNISEVKTAVDITTAGIGIFADIFKQLGKNTLYTFYISKLLPGGSIHLHKDDHPNSVFSNEIKGRSKFYWNVDHCQGVHFKYGNGVGELPLDYPLMINTYDFSHAVVNDSEQVRTVVWGYL